MATPVVQYSSPDPSLSGQANFGSFAQYLITGTNYITDSKAQQVYLFNPAVPGVLNNTDASYSQFQAYLAANPLTSVLPNPNGPSGSPATFGFPYTPQNVLPANPSSAIQSVFDQRIFEILEGMLLELRKQSLILMSMATNTTVVEQDFDPAVIALSYSGADTVSSQ